MSSNGKSQQIWDREQLETLASGLPTRAKAGAMLASVEHALSELELKAPVLNCVRKTLAVAWNWTSGVNLSARQVYDLIEPLNEVASEHRIQGRDLLLIQGLGAALYYLAWVAYNSEAIVENGKISVPNDVFDVTEDEFIESLEKVAQTVTEPVAEWRWQASLLSKLRSDFRATGENSAGDPLPKSYFVEKGFVNK